MALKLDVLANTRQMVTEMKKGGASVEDISDALDELRRQGDKATEELERSFKDLAREAERTDKKIESVGTSGFKKASGAGSEFKSEALSNFSEVTSSFDGSMSSIADLAQGTLGGIAANIPGIGIAGGIAALGVGAITAELTNAGERSKEIKDSIVQDFIDIGDALDTEAVTERIEKLLGDDGARKEAQLLADVLNIDVPSALLVMAGDFESAGVTAEDAIAGINNASSNVDTEVWQRVKDRVDAVTDGLELGKQIAQQREDAVTQMNETEREQIDRTARVAQERYEGLAAKYGQGIDIPVRVDSSGIATAKHELEQLQRKAAAGIRVHARPGEVIWE
jgi:hypothetical protein